MTISATCKFCQASLSLKIDDSYPAQRDPMGLIPLACCNRCADFMERRRGVFYRIGNQADLLARKLATTKEARDVVGDNLRVLCKRYMRLLAEYRGVDLPDWDDKIIEEIFDQPEKVNVVIGLIPKMFKQRALI